MSCGPLMITELSIGSDTQKVLSSWLALCLNTAFCRHLLELTGEVSDGRHNLVKSREELPPKCNQHVFLRSRC